MVLTNRDEINSYVDSERTRKLFGLFLEFLEEKGHLRGEEEKEIPICIFDNEELSALEAIVKYIKESWNLSFHEIAVLLNRDDRTIWSTYSRARKKKKDHFIISECKYFVPLNIFSDRKLGVLEAICFYLKEAYGLTFHQIAMLLRRDDRTIWSSYNKARKKKV